MLPSTQHQQRQLPGPTCMHQLQQPCARAIQRRISRQLRRSWASSCQPCHSSPHHHGRPHKLATSAAGFWQGRGSGSEGAERRQDCANRAGGGQAAPRGSISHLLEGWPAGHLVRVATQQFLHTLDLSALQWLTACTCISRCILQSSGPLGQLQCWAGSIRAVWLSHRTALVLVLPETPGCHMNGAG